MIILKAMTMVVINTKIGEVSQRTISYMRMIVM